MPARRRAYGRLVVVLDRGCRIKRLRQRRNLDRTGKDPMKAQPALRTECSGLRYYPAYLSRAQQSALLADVRKVLNEAPLFSPRMPKTGQPMSVRMSNCGPLGWITDETGYLSLIHI